MSYLGAVNVIKDVSESVNPTGLFVHCRTFEASLKFSEVDKQIFLYPISANVDVTNHYYESWECLMGFYFQDAPDSTELEQQALIVLADEMATDFLDELNEVEGIELSGIRKEPSYRKMAGTYTGYIISFTMGATTDTCPILVQIEE